MEYIHFTSLKHALRIERSQCLWESSIVNGVYAAPVGGEYVPGTQRTELGRAENRNYAVLFATRRKPERLYPEEAVWHTQALQIEVLKCLRAEEAIRLLDGSGGIKEKIL